MKKKASELKVGDVIRFETWSSFWMRVSPATGAVMDVQESGNNLNIMVKAKVDGSHKEYVKELFVPSDTEYILA